MLVVGLTAVWILACPGTKLTWDRTHSANRSFVKGEIANIRNLRPLGSGAVLWSLVRGVGFSACGTEWLRISRRKTGFANDGAPTSITPHLVFRDALLILVEPRGVIGRVGRFPHSPQGPCTLFGTWELL